MNEIVMGVPKKPNESVFITDIGDGILVFGQPDVGRNPMTGRIERIDQVVITDDITYCPKCKKANPTGVEITILETVFVYNCKMCNKFVWCRKR